MLADIVVELVWADEVSERPEQDESVQNVIGMNLHSVCRQSGRQMPSQCRA